VCQIIYLGNEHVTRLSQAGISSKSILSVSGSIFFSKCHFSTLSLTLSIPTYFFCALNVIYEMICGTEMVNNLYSLLFCEQEIQKKAYVIINFKRIILFHWKSKSDYSNGWGVELIFLCRTLSLKKKTDVEEVDTGTDIRVFVFYFIEWKDNQTNNLP